MKHPQNHIQPAHRSGYYFHPRPDTRTTNTYVLEFYHALKQQVRVVNDGHKPESRAGELMRHVLRTKVLVLNWPEDILYLRGGWIQAIVFNLCTLLVKIRGGQVVWICHNRKTHHKGKARLSRWNRAFFKRVADTIIVHAADALESFPDEASKTVFLPHPRYQQPKGPLPVLPAQASVLIWGSVSPYKGLDGFIENYKKQGADFSVLIRGKAAPAYFALLQQAAEGTNIRLHNELLTEQELERAFAACQIILLPYTDSDTFSSGALIHSLNARKIVIGPHVGNFIDLADAGACLTYKNQDELFTLIQTLLADKDNYQQTLARLQQGISRYLAVNSWEAFVTALLANTGVTAVTPHPLELPPNTLHPTLQTYKHES